MKWVLVSNTWQYVKNGIVLARIWKRYDGFWQIAVDLPNPKLERHLAASLKHAKAISSTAVTVWFEDIAK